MTSSLPANNSLSYKKNHFVVNMPTHEKVPLDWRYTGFPLTLKPFFSRFSGLERCFSQRVRSLAEHTEDWRCLISMLN